jgi:hypothetical protein
MANQTLTQLPVATAATNGDVLYLVDDYVEGNPSLTGISKQIYFSAFTNSITVNPFPYTGNASITGSLTVTDNINGIKVWRGGGSSDQNTAVGAQAMANSSWSGGDNGNYNTALGFIALTSNVNGFGNTAVGSGSLQLAAAGYENTGFGFQTLFFSTNGGSQNTAIGSRALNYLQNGSMNTALGTDAGRWTTSGGTGAMVSSDNSIFIGYRAHSSGDSLTNQIVIGTYARGNGSNTTTIGNSSTTSLFLGGSPGEGIVMLSPNGTRYRMTIANGGTLSISAF